MLGLKRHMLEDIGSGDVVHFADGTTAEVELVLTMSDNEKFVKLQFDTMISNLDSRYVYCASHEWSNVGWFNKTTGKRASVIVSWDVKEDNGTALNHIIKVDRIGEHLSYTAAKELIEAKYGTIRQCVCERALLLDDRSELHQLSELKVDDTVRFRNGQVARVEAIEETEYLQHPYLIKFNRVITFANGKMCLKEAGYRGNGLYGVFGKSEVDIVAIIPSGLSERAAKVKKEYGEKQKVSEMKKNYQGVSLDKLKAGDSITFRDGQTVTVTEVDCTDSRFCITFNKKVRMKEPSGVMAVDFEIFRRDGTVMLGNWKNKDIVAIIPAERKDGRKEAETTIGLTKLCEGDQVVLSNGKRGIVHASIELDNGFFVVLGTTFTNIFGEEVEMLERVLYNMQGIPVNSAPADAAKIVKIIKTVEDAEPMKASELDALKAEVAKLKKQVAALTSLNGSVKTYIIKDTGKTPPARKVKPKKKGKHNAD